MDPFVALRRSPIRVVAMAVAVLCAVVSTAAPAAAAVSPPPQPAVNQLGGEGPCATSLLSALPLPTLLAPLQLTWTYEPTGTGSPRTGGACNDNNRPVVFMAHGWLGILPNFYQEVINNMVSNGYIVVFANYSILAIPSFVYPQVDAGFQQAVSLFGRRMNLADIGIWGHSYGAGMTPWLVQQANAHGWGRHSLWFSMNATYTAFMVGSGSIAMPQHARGHMVAFEGDGTTPRAMGLAIYNRLNLPATQKTHITVTGECYGGTCVNSGHLSPNSGGFANAEDYLDYFSLYRNYQALADCARAGTFCGADLTYMGTWADGHVATPSVATHTPS